MRLLNIHTFELRECTRNPPPYVIASHRWKAGTEACLKDLRKNRNAHKDGYRKVEGFAKYVRDHICHIDWLWIDTCCVDQRSSQEVTEAVNSMFRWYADAEVCLAWLTDVENAGEESEFRRSNWFDRGWTLQELLAPHVTLFLSSDWELIGHKGGGGWTKSGFLLNKRPGLESVIAEVTSIPKNVLHNFNESMSCSVEERLTWIDRRTTTKEEDMSYSMLGVFGVAMPVCYGEGAGKARRRLLEEIGKRSLTQGSTGRRTPPSHTAEIRTQRSQRSSRYSLMTAWLTVPVPCAIIPFRRDPDYVARDDIIDRIRQKLSSREGRVALVGLGGVG